MIGLHLPATQLCCGDVVYGTVQWASDRAPIALRVDVEWFTEGRGTTNRGRVGGVRWVHDDRVPGSIPAPAEFAVVVPPQGPCSYDGQLIRVIWEVTATLELSWSTDPQQRQRIVVIPRRVPAAAVTPHLQ